MGAIAVSAVGRPMIGAALMIAAGLVFSSHDALTKYLSELYPIVFIVWVRYLVHTALMAGLFMPSKGHGLLRSRRPWLQTLRALCLLSVSILFIAALAYIPLAEATAVNYLAPLLVIALSAPLLGERVSGGQWLAVLLGFVGVLCVVHPGSDLFTPAILLPLGSAFCYAFYQLLTRRLSTVDSSTTSNFLTGLINTLVLSLVVPFFWVWPSAEHLLLLVAVGVCGMLAHQLMTQAYHHAPPALLAPLGYAQVVFAGVLGYWVFAQIPSVLSIIGIVIVCCSGLAVLWLSRRG